MDINRNSGLMKNLYLDIINENLSNINACDVFQDEFEDTKIRIELINEDDEYLIEGYFPGIQKKDIKIDYKDDYLYIRVKKKQFFSNRDNTAMMIISDSRDFKRNFYIPNSEIEKLNVSFTRCKLLLKIPKMSCAIKDEERIVDVDYKSE